MNRIPSEGHVRKSQRRPPEALPTAQLAKKKPCLSTASLKESVMLRIEKGLMVRRSTEAIWAWRCDCLDDVSSERWESFGLGGAKSFSLAESRCEEVKFLEIRQFFKRDNLEAARSDTKQPTAGEQTKHTGILATPKQSRTSTQIQIEIVWKCYETTLQSRGGA
ncbi:hypothetical protein M407DRAFT_232977 [Tulasnella calospora MUT 4182]|uniref:Uncharacterized protein n=1 Tax=Tulasnella calospora MUT 4182 TaxID=1051891 RepID=A0A0C3QAQ0_9AGAM|nr:hypothetical protein M407DRAFT_232977 [Tulasnella calospora MUT 4182]